MKGLITCVFRLGRSLKGEKTYTLLGLLLGIAGAHYMRWKDQHKDTCDKQ